MVLGEHRGGKPSGSERGQFLSGADSCVKF